MADLKAHVLASVFTLIFLLLFPFGLLLLLPVYIYRWILAKILVPIFRPDLDKLVVSRNAVLATDNPYKSPNWNLCVWIVVEENLDFENFTKTFYNNIVCKKLPNGRYADPEYQQHYHKFLGFLFWQWDTDFSVKNHMRTFQPYPGSPFTTEQQLKKLLKKLAWAPFAAEKSPWEFLFVPNYVSETDENTRPDKSVLIFRIHHGMCDGLVILKLLMQELNGVSVGINASPHYAVIPWWKRALRSLAFPLQGPYQFFRMMAEAKDDHPWHPQDRGLAFEREKGFIALTKRVPIQLLKDVKNHFDVSFNAVVVSIISAGLRKLMVHQGIQVPKNISTGLPCPMPRHPDKLRNHFIFAFLKLPVGISDPVARLQKIEHNLNELKHSVVPLFNWNMIPLLGSLFHYMVKPLNRNSYSTTIISNFPGPAGGNTMETEGWFIADGGRHWITDMNFCGGGGDGDVGVAFCLLSYFGGMRIITESSGHITKSQEEVEKLNEFILEELQLLHSLVTI